MERKKFFNKFSCCDDEHETMEVRNQNLNQIIQQSMNKYKIISESNKATRTNLKPQLELHFSIWQGHGWVVLFCIVVGKSRNLLEILWKMQ